MSIQVRPGEVLSQTASGIHEGGEGPIDEADLATVTFSWLDMADAQVGASVPGTYSSDGTYIASLTAPTDFGRYRLQVATTLTGFTTYAYRDVTVGVAYQGGTTVADIRRSVASQLRDWVGLEATSTSAGLSTFTDADNLVGESYSYVSSQAIITVAHPDNVGLVRVVRNNDGNGVLTFARDLPQPIVAGDKADLVNLAGKGFTRQKYDEAIKGVLRDARRDVRIPIQADIPAAFDRDTGVIALPYSFTEVYNVEYAYLDNTYALAPARTRSAFSDGWFADGNGNLRLEGRFRSLADGQTIRVYGYGYHPDVYADDDIISIDSEWVVLMAAARLARLRTFDREWSQWAALWTQQADGRRLAMAPAYEPDSRTVR